MGRNGEGVNDCRICFGEISTRGESHDGDGVRAHLPPSLLEHLHQTPQQHDIISWEQSHGLPKMPRLLS